MVIGQVKVAKLKGSFVHDAISQEGTCFRPNQKGNLGDVDPRSVYSGTLQADMLQEYHEVRSAMKGASCNRPWLSVPYLYALLICLKLMIWKN